MFGPQHQKRKVRFRRLRFCLLEKIVHRPSQTSILTGLNHFSPKAYGLHPLCLRLTHAVTGAGPRLDTECGGSPLLRRHSHPLANRRLVAHIRGPTSLVGRGCFKTLVGDFTSLSLAKTGGVYIGQPVHMRMRTLFRWRSAATSAHPGVLKQPGPGPADCGAAFPTSETMRLPRRLSPICHRKRGLHVMPPSPRAA